MVCPWGVEVTGADGAHGVTGADFYTLDVVAIRTGNALSATAWNADYSVLDPLITPIVRSVTRKIAVPTVTGQTETNAATAIDQAGLAISSVTRQSSTSVAAGRVISQTPTAGSQVARNTGVRLVISTGK